MEWAVGADSLLWPSFALHAKAAGFFFFPFVSWAIGLAAHLFVFSHLQWMGIPHSAALPNAVLDWSLGLEVAILPLANRVAVMCISQLGCFSLQSLTVCTSGGEGAHELAASLPL